MNAEVVAIRALFGQSERIGANLEHGQARLTKAMSEGIIGYFHSTTFSNLAGILRPGLQAQGRLGATMSIFPPWDPRAKSMQRWQAGDRYTVTIVLNAQRVYEYIATLGASS